MKNGIKETFTGDNPEDPNLSASDSEFNIKINPRVGRSGKKIKKVKKKVNKKEIKKSSTTQVDDPHVANPQQLDSDMITPVGGVTVIDQNIPELSSEEESTDEDQEEKQPKPPKSKAKFNNVCTL